MKLATISVIACAVLAVPLAAQAQMSDVQYCRALSDVWRAYNRGNDPAAGVATAISQCNGKPASSIPVLEKALTDDKIKLPKRG